MGRVLVGTAAHELAQELADYLVLTGPDAQLTPITALAMNFVSGMGVLLGTVIILASEVGNDAIGILLAFGGGSTCTLQPLSACPESTRMICSCAQESAALRPSLLGPSALVWF